MAPEPFYGVPDAARLPSTDETHCDWSFLRKEHCAHCLGHKLDEEGEAMVRVNLR